MTKWFVVLSTDYACTYVKGFDTKEEALTHLSEKLNESSDSRFFTIRKDEERQMRREESI